jgi:hypothetical protein
MKNTLKRASHIFWIGKNCAEFYDLVWLGPSTIEEGLRGLEVTFAKGKPNECVINYEPVKSNQAAPEIGIENGQEFVTPSSTTVCYNGQLFRRTSRKYTTLRR